MEIHIDAYENDRALIPYLNCVLFSCKEALEILGHEMNFTIIQTDFIIHAEEQNNRYNYVISNPPYYKMTKSCCQSMILKHIVNGQPNIYTHFMAQSVKLLKSGVILGFRANIDFKKLGYKWFKIFLNLKDYNDSNLIIDYLINNHDLHSVERSLGGIDLQLHFILKDVDQLHQIINDISNKFPDKIKNYTYHNVIKSYKWNYLPEI